MNYLSLIFFLKLGFNFEYQINKIIYVYIINFIINLHKNSNIFN